MGYDFLSAVRVCPFRCTISSACGFLPTIKCTNLQNSFNLHAKPCSPDGQNLCQNKNDSYRDIYCNPVLATIGQALDFDRVRKKYETADLNSIMAATRRPIGDVLLSDVLMKTKLFILMRKVVWTFM
ncbi:MAG: hypothetical protein PHH86_10465 [Sphaerochaetaceae bacterium]|jgi:hypothetical protein|nr:hypothetical protein [Sphaerochaetaceae bacterium]